MNILVLTIIGLILSFKHKGTLHNVIAGGLVLSIIIQFIPRTNLSWLSALVQFAMAFLAMLYVFKESDLGIREKFGVVLMGSIITVSMLFQILHLPFGSLMRLILIFPILLFVFNSFQNGLNVNKHFGFMFIWFVMAIHSLSSLLH